MEGGGGGGKGRRNRRHFLLEPTDGRVSGKGVGIAEREPHQLHAPERRAVANGLCQSLRPIQAKKSVPVAGGGWRVEEQ